MTSNRSKAKEARRRLQMKQADDRRARLNAVRYGTGPVGFWQHARARLRCPPTPGVNGFAAGFGVGFLCCALWVALLVHLWS